MNTQQEKIDKLQGQIKKRNTELQKLQEELHKLQEDPQENVKVLKDNKAVQEATTPVYSSYPCHPVYLTEDFDLDYCKEIYPCMDWEN